MKGINSILESLNYNRYREQVINEAVKVTYDDVDKMKKSSRIIKKTFGKITSPKETWYNMQDVMSNPDDKESPLAEKYYSKYFNINSSYEFPIEEVLNTLKKYRTLDVERIIKSIYKGSNEKFHIEQISNLRFIFQSDKNKNHRLELRYDKKLFKKDSKEDVDDTIESPDETMSDEELKRVEMEERAQQKASEYKIEDDKNVDKKKKFVLDTMSNKLNKFIKEKVNESDIEKDSGADKKIVKAAALVADELFDSSSKEEPKISKELINVVRSLGGTMYGLDFRLKQPTSLGRKIATDTKVDSGYGGDVIKAANDVKDTIRYTVIYDLDDFTEKYYATRKALEDLGYVELRCKNFYTKFANNKSAQKAIQCVYFKRPNGVKFELQFHTVESQGVKEVNHPLYEKWRSDDTSSEEKLVLSQRMKNMGKDVPDPIGVFDIKEHS